MKRRRSPRRKPIAVQRAVRQATAFQDPASEALVQHYLASFAAQGRAVDAPTQEAIRRAIADRAASLAASQRALPPRALVLQAINSYARPTDPSSVLAEAKQAQPRESLGNVAVGAVKQALLIAVSVGLGPLPRLGYLVVTFAEQLVAGLRRRKSSGAEVPAAVDAPTSGAVRVPVLDGGDRDLPRAALAGASLPAAQ